MRNEFNLSHQHKLSTDMGYLVPIANLEVLPGDTFIQSTSLLARVAPLVNPVMHNVDIRVHHWYVPTRLTDPNWEEWIVGKRPEDKPKIQMDGIPLEETWLTDHLGIHPLFTGEIDAAPIRAYNAIYNEFYRDQDLQLERNADELTLARIAWEKDYFTTARPKPQQGDPVSIGFSTGLVGLTAPDASGSTTAFNYNATASGNPETEVTVGGTQNHLYADLSAATGGIDVTDLQRSIALQRIARARMRYGSRYVDYLRFLGINPSDGRLDRPEYLGGGGQQINFSEVLATAEGSTTNVGDMYGHGIAGVRSKRYRKMFEEHGWVISLLSVRPKTVYMDATPRKFQRFDPMDHWQKELEVLPWQEVYKSEVHYNGASDEIFGYVPRYDEYRQEMSYVSGSFREGPEVDWHFAREFAGAPSLNSSFIECTPADRPFADKNMPELLVNANHNIKAMRLVRANASV